MKRTKLQVLRDLARSRSYVVITDKQSTINIAALRGDNLNDAVTVAAQRNSLVQFRDGLNRAIKDYDKQVAKQVGVKVSPKLGRKAKVRKEK